MKTPRQNQDLGNKGIIVAGGGSFTARNVAVGSRASIVDNSSAGSGREELAQHFETIQKELSRIPNELTEARNTIEAFAAALKQEAEKEKPNPGYWKVTSAGLIDAAKSVATVAPSLLNTALLVAKAFG